MLNLNVHYLEGPEGEEPKGMPNPFPSHFPSQIPLPSAQIPFARAEFRKNPGVLHTNSFFFTSTILRLLNMTQPMPKHSPGFEKMF